MHWTALLAYRRHPEKAMVADDLFCLGCGYNLRALRARANCPECGRRVDDSLVLLEQPARVAGALATIGRSYLGLFAVGLLFVASRTGSSTVVWLMLMILMSTVLLRCVGALELRFLAGLKNRPQVTNRVALLWWAILLEFLATFALFFIWAFGAMQGIENTVAIAWSLTTLASVIAAGRSGIGLARLLEYDGIVRELWAQQILLAGALLLGATAVVLRVSFTALPATGNTGANAMVYLVYGLAVLVGIAAIVVTVTGLLRLSIAAHSETEPLDHLITTDQSQVIAPPPPSSRLHEPDIPIESGRPRPKPKPHA